MQKLTARSARHEKKFEIPANLSVSLGLNSTSTMSGAIRRSKLSNPCVPRCIKKHNTWTVLTARLTIEFEFLAKPKLNLSLA